MMEVEYRREMNRNYMVIHPEQKRNDKYTIEMLSGNSISGFLPFREKWLNGEPLYYYDITSRQPLGRILEHRNLTGEELWTLLSGILFAVRQMERYLLDESQVNFEPDYIYVEPDSFRCLLCLIPGQYGDFSAEFRELSQYLLDHVNHNDGDAVVLAFSVFRECRKENFGLDDIERCFGKFNSRERNGTEKSSAERNSTEGLKEPPVDKGKLLTNGEETVFSDWNLGTGKGCKGIQTWETESKESVKVKDPAQIRDSVKVKDPAKTQNLVKVKELLKAVFNEEATNEAAEDVDLLDSNGGKLWRLLPCVSGVGMILFPLGLFTLGGFDNILRWKWILAALEVLLASMIVISLNGGGSMSQQKDDSGENEEEEGWEVYFREESSGGRTNESEFSEDRAEENEEEELQTMLLTARPVYQESRRLISVDSGIEILLRYFPFIIGKSKSISDFCLDEPGVSRLHLKIEEKEGRYTVTDLNSTNGTMVNGHLLDANETCELPLGGELTIAARKFRFQ